MRTFKIVHGHVVYEVNEELWKLICLHAAGVKDKQERYDIIMRLLEQNPGNFTYLEHIHFVS